ncbi:MULTISPECIES: TetR/AcrR family transcriptional regulator [unclassified Arthrobacter]|uniref:TetR/AcrR family transcriptional regulator n=1 Tax=unclassified Arthrobacter TaxID=235627 RepID=UPI001D133DEF|nr:MULTISPECIES: TetR/AcrR family transcriptional regulator [unclassified Arthrobacter]MCC3277788.1 TetR/AcrR family transcriptional regulator [Arthrobacter sp. zg-Y40]MCC9176192.1 TetR/AcrR family transcriptional regulator [Arthrobacter sp. zg-Y750]MCC3276781.1 TetR/AcrR family transcriptional regulator [Arthrobacter sp. zg-Y20]MDK1316939.1 TetR/AcrR family transcriptional regulator [Arthrobacter sp. zg.Y20]MDK1327116.1 TetR/AcrR family transcriptional regulator [Arthrobacter sp. zg-Y1143]
MSNQAAGKPVRLPREERRRQLLNAAQEVFVSNGFHGAAMDEIAEAAHVSKPVLYQHFPGKRELYMALLDNHLNTLTEFLDTALKSTTDNKLRVRETMRAYFRFVAQDSQGHRMVFESDLTSDAEVSARIEEFNARFASSIAGVIAEDTKLSQVEATLLGRALAGMAQVSARYWLETDGDLDIDAASELVYRLAWRGISRFPKEI